jgi:hypothetical protein
MDLSYVTVTTILSESTSTKMSTWACCLNLKSFRDFHFPLGGILIDYMLQSNNWLHDETTIMVEIIRIIFEVSVGHSGRHTGNKKTILFYHYSQFLGKVL